MFLIFNLKTTLKSTCQTEKFSSAAFYSKNDSNFANNRIQGVEIAKQEVKTNFFKALQRINIYESTSVLNYFEEQSDKNRELHTLIDSAKLFKVEYPNLNTIKYSYYINIYGEDSLMSLVVGQGARYTEDLKSYVDYPFTANYSGIIIDARGELTSFDGLKVKVKPALFITVKDADGRIIFNQNNVFPEAIKAKGMVKYSYDINEDNSSRVGKNPLKIVAEGTGDKSGSVIIITVNNSKKMLSSDITKKAIQNGNVVIIIEP